MQCHRRNEHERTSVTNVQPLSAMSLDGSRPRRCRSRHCASTRTLRASRCLCRGALYLLNSGQAELHHGQHLHRMTLELSNELLVGVSVGRRLMVGQLLKLWALVHSLCCASQRSVAWRPESVCQQRTPQTLGCGVAWKRVLHRPRIHVTAQSLLSDVQDMVLPQSSDEPQLRNFTKPTLLPSNSKECCPWLRSHRHSSFIPGPWLSSS